MQYSFREIEQSSEVYHIYNNQDLQMVLDCSDLDLTIDRRNKIEDLDNFIRYLKSRDLYNDKLESELDLYLKFHNN